MQDVTPLLTHWSYVFLALTHRYGALWGPVQYKENVLLVKKIPWWWYCYIETSLFDKLFSSTVSLATLTHWPICKLAQFLIYKFCFNINFTHSSWGSKTNDIDSSNRSALSKWQATAQTKPHQVAIFISLGHNELKTLLTIINISMTRVQEYGISIANDLEIPQLITKSYISGAICA